MLLVGCGAMIGAVIRYLITSFYKQFKVDWPFATLLINLSGALLLGMLTKHYATNPVLMSFWGVGILGGYTTFSTLNTELVSLIDEQRWKDLVIYLLLSYIGGIGCALLGLIL